MTADEFRAIALALPEAHEAPHFERASFRVGKKIFATLAADGRTGMIAVKPVEKTLALIEADPAAFFSFGAWTTRNGSLGVTLGNADPGLVRELLADAWAAIAPKRAKR